MSQFDDRLQQFKDAARALDEAWTSDQAVDGYPEYLPSFDELVADFAGVESQPVLECEATEVSEQPYQTKPCEQCGTEDVGRYSRPPQTLCDDCEADEQAEQEYANRMSPDERAAMEAYYEKEAARGELAGTPETLPCYECSRIAGVVIDPLNESNLIERKVVALGPIAEAHRDPTQTYKLACGHVTI